MKVGIEIKVNPNATRAQKAKLGQFVEKVMNDFSTIAATKTPVRTGAAQKAWHASGSGVNTVAVNTKPYIQRLEDNWSTQTRGQGILKPTLNQIRKKYKI
jgi:hypothetical protein